MAAHWLAFPTPRGGGKSDLQSAQGGGVARLPDVVAHRLWWVGTTACLRRSEAPARRQAHRAPSRKPRSAVVGVQFR